MKEQIREMTDSEKLRVLAQYFDKMDKVSNDYGFNEVQKDLRRIADNLDKPPVSQTNSLLIAMLESQLKVEIKKQEAYLFTIKEGNTQAGHVMNALLLVCVRTSAELERQINELKK